MLLLSLINNISILNDVLVSDHKPISFDIAGININHTEMSVTVDSDVCSVPVWSNCNDKTLAYYTSYVDHLFQYVTIPYDAVYDTTRDKVHLIDIDKFYTDICACACLSKAIKDIIPCHNRLFLVVMCPVRTLMLLRNTRRPEEPIWYGWTWAHQDMGITLTI